MMKAVVSMILALTTCGCMAEIAEIGVPPTMSPVGSGMRSDGIMMASARPPQAAVSDHGYSLWRDGSGNLFKDRRAMRPGDVLTVRIQINDRASLDNSTNRSRDARSKYGLGLTYDFESSVSPEPFSLGLSGDGNVNSATSTNGQGSIDRSEDIRLSIAAVVLDVMPNGNLVIRGSQEVRVNHELRVLNIAGIVRPQDVSGDNVIGYDKIAEARISYGGRGRVSDVQRPGWGQQLLDTVAPF